MKDEFYDILVKIGNKAGVLNESILEVFDKVKECGKEDEDTLEGMKKSISEYYGIVNTLSYFLGTLEERFCDEIDESKRMNSIDEWDNQKEDI